MTFVPIKNHTGMGITEVILTFLQENLIDFKYCRGQSYYNASNMPGKYKGVQQRIKKNLCSYTEFCSCFAHSLDLAGPRTVEVNTAAVNFFLISQQLLKFQSSSTHFWEKLEDMLKNTSTKAHFSFCKTSIRYPLVFKIRRYLRASPYIQ